MALKVLHLIDSGGLYGAERMLLALVRKQRAHGIDAMVLSAGFPGEGEKAIEQACVEQGLPCTPWRMKPGLNLSGGAEVAAWAKENGFSVLHSHGYKFNILIGLLSRKQRAPAFVSTIHGYTASRVFSKLFVYKALDFLLSYRPDRVVVVTDGLRKSLLSKNNVRFIPNGIDIDEGTSKAAPVRLHGGRYIVVVGRLSAEKAIHTAIGAFSRVADEYPDYSLVIIGDGPEKKELQALAAKSGLADKVVFTGYSDHAGAYIGNAEALLISSETEGLPLTLLEAVRVQTPVVSTPVGEIPNVLGHGKFGYLSSDISEASVFRALAEVLANPALASEKARLAYDRFLSEYTSDQMNERYRTLYQEVLAP
ncbi:glycosyltransferase [Marinobacter flavimaris]|uniref:glycosyltransferase n=1 Tax=Marinobacter flavimaris TaxID=262076 RepID=UPI003868F996